MTDIEQQVRAVRLPHLDNLETALVAWIIGGHALLGYSTVRVPARSTRRRAAGARRGQRSPQQRMT